MKCNGCNLTFVAWNGIQGVVHERGCPDAWKDEVRSCSWCGSEFKPDERHQIFCDPSCSDSNYDQSFWRDSDEYNGR